MIITYQVTKVDDAGDDEVLFTYDNVDDAISKHRELDNGDDYHCAWLNIIVIYNAGDLLRGKL